MAAGVGIGVGVAFGCAAFDFFFCLLLFAAVAAAVVVVVVFVVAAALLGVFVGAAAAAVGVVCCCFCGLASFSPALISLLLLLGACFFFFFFFFFFLAVSGVTVVVVVAIVSDVTSDLERFLGFSSGNTVLCLQTAQSTACGNKKAFKSSKRKRERIACTYHPAAHSLLYPLGAFSGRRAQTAAALRLLGLDHVQLGYQPTPFGIVRQTLRLQMQLIVAIGPLVAATGTHATGAHAILRQLDIVFGQLAACVAMQTMGTQTEVGIMKTILHSCEAITHI